MGLYYLNARYYNPEDGRFMTEDSYRGEIMNPETGHLYVYCANNPVNYVDPSGHFAAAMYTVIKLVLVGGAVAYVSYSSWKNHSSKTKYAGRKIISKFTDGPAKAYGLYPQKGSLMVGSYADIVIYDENIKEEKENKTMVKVTVNVEGMMCGHCEAHVNKAIQAAFGAEDVVSSHENGTTVFSVPEKVDEAKVEEVIKEAGYEFKGITQE